MYATETALNKKLLLALFARYTKRSILIWDGGSISLPVLCILTTKVHIKHIIDNINGTLSVAAEQGTAQAAQEVGTTAVS